MTHTDTERLDWVLDILALTNNEREGSRKAMRMMEAILAGKVEREAIDAAMES